MKLFGIFITACVVIAAAQAVATAAVALSVLAFLVGLVVAPKETFGLIGLGMVVVLISVQPLAFLGVFALMVVAKMLRGAHDAH